MRGHVVVCGSDGLAVRVVEELRALEEDVVLVVPDESCRPFRRSREWGIQTLVGDFQEDEVLRAAGIAEARAVALLEDQDVGNLHAALAAQELGGEEVDLVVRIFNAELGANFEPLIPHARFLSAFYDLSPADAFYFTVTTVTTTGYGDINLLDANAALKVYGVGLMLLGALTIAVLYALVTDAIVGARLARELGQPPRPSRDHVIVCGLGAVGFRVVERLAQQGVECVAIDRDDERFGDAARRLGAPVIEGDAANSATLRSLRVETARAVVAVTDDDVANLETAVAVRAIRPDMRIVARLFDPDLADRVQRALSINISRSVSTLAAPAFVAALYERRTLAVVPVGTRALVVAAVSVPSGSALMGARLGEIADRYDAHVLSCGGAWRPAADETVCEGDLVVLASRQGVAHIEQAILGGGT